jgi:diguanylate cyclase (GGDEF)-like protein
MKLPPLSIASRLMLTLLVMIAISGIGFAIVIRSLSSVESVLDTEAREHVSLLRVNSIVSRQVFELTTRVQLMEQAFLYSESVLNEEGFNIDEQLQRLRELAANRIFSDKMDKFVDDFNRFLGSSLTLNRILKETKEIDKELSDELDQLDFLVSDRNVHLLLNDKLQPIDNDLSLVNMLRESFLTVGKMVGTIRSRITPDTEKVVIIEVQKELDIFQLHLTNLDTTDEAMALCANKLNRTVMRYNAALRKMQANLDQRWTVMASLVKSQNELLSLVETTESDVQRSAIDLTQALERDVAYSRLQAVIVAILAIMFGLLLISRLVRNHIRSPLQSLSDSFEQIESSEFHQRISLGRSDEWNTIENAFNKMACRLEEIYSQLNKEKKNFDFLAHHDPLTGLANRLLITQRLQAMISEATIAEHAFVILYLDVDQFKIINDSLGHSAGDRLLTDVSRSLETIVADKGIVARMGGDEFLVVLPTIDNIDAGVQIADRINQSLRTPYFVEDKTLFVSTSIGVCLFPDHGSAVATLIRNADTAMYHAKRQGRDRCCVYTSSMTLEANDMINLSSGIRQAIEKDEFEVEYQPQYDLKTQKISGAEALVRWNHPTLGRLEPIEFLEVADKTGLLADVDNWVLKNVIYSISKWLEDGVDLTDILFSVNFSARKFYDANVLNYLDELLKDSLCTPDKLMLEITERDVMSGIETSAQTIVALRNKGFRIAIDDFGTGHSSLALLKNIAADKLKLDRSFIIDIAVSERDFSIVRAIMALAKELNLTVIAEGAETHEQVKRLIEIECDEAQGFVFSKSLSAEEWIEQLFSR